MGSKKARQAELTGLFDQTREVIKDFIESRSQAEKAAIGSAEAWSAKDLLANVACWMEYMVERMEYFERGKTPPRQVDFGAVGQRAFVIYQRRPWADAVAYAERSLNALVDKVSWFSDEQLAARNIYTDVGGGPLWGEIRANGFIYPLQEFEKYYKRQGEIARAEAVNTRWQAVVGETSTISAELIEPQALHEQQSSEVIPLVIDVRGQGEYEAGHVQGALNIPLSALPRRLKRLPQDRLVVTYCNMHHPGESRGERAAELLKEKGYHAAALNGGFPAWKDAGLPVETT